MPPVGAYLLQEAVVHARPVAFADVVAAHDVQDLEPDVLDDARGAEERGGARYYVIT